MRVVGGFDPSATFLINHLNYSSSADIDSIGDRFSIGEIIGVGHLGWMLLLTGVMTVEKVSPWSKIFIPIVGVGLIVWGAVTIAHSII